MYQKLLAASLAVAVLSACSDDPKTEQQELACNQPAVMQAVQQNIQEIIQREARLFARNDSRQFVDADKIIAAGAQLEISLDNPHTVREGNKPLCNAGLNIHIPAEIMSSADTNSPLIYGNVSLADLIGQKVMGSHLSFSGNTFTTALRYVPTETGVNFEDNTVTTTAQTLSATLLPYGVKSLLVIDGRAVTKEDALKMAGNSEFAEPPQANPADILENNAASQSEGVPDTAIGLETPAEVLNPSIGESRDVPSLAQSDLDQAREQNQRAEADINRIWNSMERGVQQGILEEQRSWIQSKNQNCAQAAAGADSPAQAQYLQLQCDTRMTRERVQYLRGFTIN